MDFRILGPLEALDEGREVKLGGSKQRALLAVFLLHRGETLSTDRLIDELWGERPPAGAAKAVQVAISRLRKALAGGEGGDPDGVVVTRGRGYELELDPERLDAHRFERLLEEGRGGLAAGHPEQAAAALEAALATWRGAPLADLAYEPFAQHEIARLEDLRVAALEQLIEAKLALGSHAEVVSQLETLIAEHPYRERLWGQLMLALYRCDRQADALQAYQNARRQLVEELGIEPGERLRELERAILAQDPALAAPLGRDDGDAAPRGATPHELPTGVVTFLLTDIEGSSGLWEADLEGMAAALEMHDELIARTVEAHAGRLLKTKGEGDATVTVFPRASDAVAAAVDLQEALGAASWPGELELRVRIALHTGEAHERAGDYFGPALNRAARLRALARGGATVVSQATAEIVHDRLPAEMGLVDLGRRELRGLTRPENVFELRPVATQAETGARVDLRILGPLEVIADGDSIPLGGPRERVLLVALLLRAREPVAPDVLVQALWGEEASATARKALQVHVSHLRGRLGTAAERLVTTPAGYRLDVAPHECDAGRFEALCARAAALEPAAAAQSLAEALSLWRGPALADLRYESFLQPEIARLEELRWTALEDRMEAELALGRHGTVAAELERLAAEAPLRERLVEQRMRALYGAGRQVEALAAYREARQRLDEELGLEPGPALRELERAILTHAPALGAEPAHRPPPPPVPPTATIGRETDLATLARVLDESRLVTLTGPGGVGKTRLAVEAARARAGQLPGGVRVAGLAPVADAADVAAALAAAVEAVPGPGERPVDALVRRLGGPATLLVVDNFEHVVTAAGVLSELLAGCDQLRILATSREPLRLRGERCVPVLPLDAPDGITLFVDRARDRRPDFRVTDDNAAAVEELCRRLDGLPLALELAAGRIGLLEPEQLVARLGDALPVLEGGPRDAPARQRTLRATLEWSVALLDEHERGAFLALAAFTGGAEVDAAETVTDAPLGVLDALVAKSLVRLRDGRLALLEVVRQFAAARLAESSQRDAVLERHAEWCLELAERLGPEVRMKGDGPALRRLQREFGNLRTALAWLLDRGDGERSLRLATALGPYWLSRDRDREGLRALDAALDGAGAASDRLRARARLARWELTWSHRDARRDDAGEALALARAGDDLEAQCMALEALARDAVWAADLGEARERARAARALAEELGDPYLVARAVSRQAYVAQTLPEALAFATEATALLRRCGSVHEIAQMLVAVVMIALDDEDYEAAEELAVEGVRAAGESGNPLLLAVALGNTGFSALFLDRIDVAQRRFRDQLAICRRERFEDEWAAEPVLGLAAVAARAGQPHRAAVLVGAAEEPFRRRLVAADKPLIERFFARFIAPARAALGASAWARAEAEGRALARETVIDLALADQIGAPRRRGRGAR
jgi:DNA-binding SARP family transcriptional activator/predicted ATPase